MGIQCLEISRESETRPGPGGGYEFPALGKSISFRSSRCLWRAHASGAVAQNALFRGKKSRADNHGGHAPGQENRRPRLPDIREAGIRAAFRKRDAPQDLSKRL